MANARLFTPALVSLILISFLTGASEFIMVGILPDVAADLDTPYQTVGVLISVFAVSYALSAPIVTMFTGRMNRYNLIMMLALVFTVTDALSMLSWNYASLALSRALNAVASGPLVAVGMTFVMDITTPENRARSVAWVFAGFSMASMFGLPVGNMVGNMFGWRAAFAFILTVAVIECVLLWRFLPRNTPVPDDTTRFDPGVFTDRRILMNMVITCATGTGVFVVYTYLTPLFQECAGIPEEWVFLFLMLYGVSCLVGTLTSGRIAEHGGFRLMRVLFLLEAVFGLMISLFSGSTVLMVASMFMFAAGSNFMNSSNQIDYLEVGRNDYPLSVSFCSSLNPVSFNLGVAFGSFIGGVIYDSMGLGMLGFGAMAFLLVSSLFSVLLVRYGRKHPEKRTSVM